MKRYDKSFNEQAVRLVLEQGRSVPSVALCDTKKIVEIPPFFVPKFLG